MYLTILSIIGVAAVAGLMKFGIIPPIQFQNHETILISTALVYFLTVSIASAITYIPRIRALKYLPTLISTLIRKNPLVVVAHIYTFLFPLLSIILAGFGGIGVLAAWFILFALAIDAFGYHLRKSSATFNPTAALDLISQQAIKTLPKDNTSELCEAYDALSEVALKSIETNSLLTGKEAIEHIRELSQAFFIEARKKKFTVDATGKPAEITDRVNFTISYLLQDFDMLYSKVISKGIEPIANELILTLGKIALYAAKADASFATIPLHAISKYALYAQHKGYTDIVIRSLITLNQVGRMYLTDQDVLRQDLKELFFTIIGRLEDITKESFKQDKTVKISLLSQPFKDLQEAISDPRLASREDIPVINADIGRVLGEFEALEMIVGGLPSIPGFETFTPPPQKEADK